MVKKWLKGLALLATSLLGECTNSGMDNWTGILEWTIGIAYFWFLHIFGGLIDSHK